MHFNNLTRILAVVLSLSAVGIAAAPPAVAQTFSFSYGNRAPLRLCLLSDYQLRQAIAAQGYKRIYLNVANNNRIQVRATKGRWVYLLTVNSCTGRILDRERYRPA